MKDYRISINQLQDTIRTMQADYDKVMNPLKSALEVLLSENDVCLRCGGKGTEVDHDYFGDTEIKNCCACSGTGKSHTSKE